MPLAPSLVAAPKRASPNVTTPALSTDKAQPRPAPFTQSLEIRVTPRLSNMPPDVADKGFRMVLSLMIDTTKELNEGESVRLTEKVSFCPGR